eukprot:TRINITY_DN9445_c0_g4_i2.p1 TRINITY_DN9445_c0_g4~~TRINITY_DN9445_c0_g4_i2.p1  ORF type:complete len:676 (+),score=252.02 TRINITY_DN9445_c0_g4_i2:72-2099(+)
MGDDATYGAVEPPQALTMERLPSCEIPDAVSDDDEGDEAGAVVTVLSDEDGSGAPGARTCLRTLRVRSEVDAEVQAMLEAREEQSKALNEALLRRTTLRKREREHAAAQKVLCPPGWDAELRQRQLDLQLAEDEFETEDAQEALAAVERGLTKQLSLLRNVKLNGEALAGADAAIRAAEAAVEEADATLRSLRRLPNAAPDTDDDGLRRLDSRVHFKLPSLRRTVESSPLHALLAGTLLTPAAGPQPARAVLGAARCVLLCFADRAAAAPPPLVDLYASKKDAERFEIVWIPAGGEDTAAPSAPPLPWPALPHDAAAGAALAAEYGAAGPAALPWVCAVDLEDGAAVWKGGAADAAEVGLSPKGYLWPAPLWSECLPETLLAGGDAAQARQTADVLKGKHVVLVYAAATAEFTDALDGFLERYRPRSGCALVVLYAGSGAAPALTRAAADVFSYPEGAAPAAARMRRRAGAACDDGPPVLAIFTSRGALQTRCGGLRLRAGPGAVASQGWALPPLSVVGNLEDGASVEGWTVQSRVAVVALCIGCGEKVRDDVADALAELAVEAFEAGAGEPAVLFFTTAGGPAADRLTAMLYGSAAPQPAPVLLALDLPNARFFEADPPPPADEITAAAVREFVAAVKSGAAAPRVLTPATRGELIEPAGSALRAVRSQPRLHL